MKYELIDHTADFGVHVFGADAQTLFVNAAEALFEALTDTDRLSPTERLTVRVSGDDWPDLMVNWMRELLYLWTGRELLGKTVEINALSEFDLAAEVTAAPYDPDVHEIKTDIKAATYHQITARPTPHGWESKIIFDV